MSLKRKKIAVPQWERDDYPSLHEKSVFSKERWGVAVNWKELLKQANKIKSVVELFEDTKYPSSLFIEYLDILDANLYFFDDMFFYLTGIRIGDDPNKIFSGFKIYDDLDRLSFWDLDCHEDIEQIRNSISCSSIEIKKIIKREELAPIHKQLSKTCGSLLEDKVEYCLPSIDINSRNKSYDYVNEAYLCEVDENDVIAQFQHILCHLNNFAIYMAHIYSLPRYIDFEVLLSEFRKSDMCRTLLLEWDENMNHEFGSLKLLLKVDPRFSPYLERYLSLKDTSDLIPNLFYDADSDTEIDELSLNNTGVWVNILSLASILRTYEERHGLKRTPGGQPKPQRGRPSAPPIRDIMNEPVDERYNKLCQELNGQKGKQAALIIKCADDAGWFKEKPKFNQLKVLGVVGASSGYNRQKKDFFSSEEIERVKKLLGIVSQ